MVTIFSRSIVVSFPQAARSGKPHPASGMAGRCIFCSASLRIGDRRRVFCAAAKPAAVALSAGLIAARANGILQRPPFNFQHYSQFRYTGGAVRAGETPVPKPAPAG